MNERSLGHAVDVLSADVDAKALADPRESWTASLLLAGRARCAKKLGEEGVEAALAVAAGTADEIAAEAADLLYHLAVALKAAGVAPEAVAAELTRRRGVSGLTEKASRG